jgi:photosystem II stability/assembly factor-like uncharacterized protein
MKRFVSCFLIAAALAAGAASHAAEPSKGQWVNISDALVAKLSGEGAKPGYAGPTAGVAVDPASGDVFLIINDRGLYRSGDRGATWARCDGGAIGGRCETGFGIDADPAGSGLAVFVVYGSSAITTDGGKTWKKSGLGHVDAVAADWTGCWSLVALRHESGGTIARTGDGGQTWQDLGKGFKGVGIFGNQTLVATKEKEDGIFRSTDGGETWAKVSDLKPSGLAMRKNKNAGYWISDAGLLVSRDAGATWAVQGAPLKMVQGPYFGKDESHIVVLTKEGFQETTDAGRSWKQAAPLPPDYTADRMTTCAWDAKAGVFYISRMTRPALKFER